MAMTVADVMRHCRNYFVSSFFEGTLELKSSGELSTATGYNMLNGKGYIAIQHVGVFRYTDGKVFGDFVPGTYTGIFYFLAPPADFVRLADEIAEYDKKTPVSALSSESFGGYSYQRATGKNGGSITWQEAFYDRLKFYCRMFTEVDA